MSEHNQVSGQMTSILDLANEIERAQADLSRDLSCDLSFLSDHPNGVPKKAVVRLLRLLVSIGFPDQVNRLLSTSFNHLFEEIFDGDLNHYSWFDSENKKLGDYKNELLFVHDYSQNAWVLAFLNVITWHHTYQKKKLIEIEPFEGPGDADEDEEDKEDDNLTTIEENDDDAEFDHLVTYTDLLPLLELPEKIDAINSNLLVVISIATIFTAIAIPGVAALAYFIVSR